MSKPQKQSDTDLVVRIEASKAFVSSGFDGLGKNSKEVYLAAKERLLADNYLTTAEIEAAQAFQQDQIDESEKAKHDAVAAKYALADKVAEAIATQFGGNIKSSNLSVSRYIQIGDLKVRVSDHDERPTYAAQNGYADFDISIAGLRDCHIAISDESGLDAVLSEVSKKLNNKHR